MDAVEQSTKPSQPSGSARSSRPSTDGRRGFMIAVVRLRDTCDEDLPILFAQQRDPEATKVAAFPARDRDAFMNHWTRILADPTVIKQTLVANGDVAGHVVAFDMFGERLVGYWIGREYWGQGIATSALEQFLCLEIVRPLRARVAKHNVGSIRVLEKCGFTLASETQVR